jgi:O-antigen/teichoic acid export membrane protein
MFRIALALTAGTSIIGAVIFAMGSQWWAPALAPELTNPGAVATYAVLNVAVSVAILVDAYLVSHRRGILVCGRNGFVALAKVGAIIGLSIVLVPKASDIYMAMLIPVAVSAFCMMLPLVIASNKAVHRDNRDLSHEFIRYSFKNYPGALLDGAPTFLLPVLVLRLVGPTEYAYFFVAWSVSSVVSLLAAAIGQVTLRETSTLGGRYNLAKHAQVLALTVTGLAVLTLFLAARLALHLFGSHYVYASVLPLRLLLFSTIPGAHLTITIALLRSQKRYSAVNVVSIAYAALSIGATVGLGVVSGITGVCVGWLVGVSLAAGFAVVAASRQPARPAPIRFAHATTLEEGYEPCAAKHRRATAPFNPLDDQTSRTHRDHSNPRGLDARGLGTSASLETSWNTAASSLASWRYAARPQPFRASANGRY